MENNQLEDRKLCFMDCMWNILFKWRRVIVAMFFFSVLLCGLKYVKDSKGQAEAERNITAEVSTEDIQTQIQKLTDIDKTQVETTMYYVKSLYDKKNYAKDAAVMKLDPYNVKRIELRYSIESEKNTAKLVQAYSKAIYTPEAKSLLVADSGGTLKSSDVSDMIIVESNGENFQSYNANKYVITANNENEQIITANNGNALLQITVRGNNEKQAKILADRVKLILAEYSATAKSVYDSHSLELIGESSLNGKDGGVIAVQDDIFRVICEMSRNITESTGKMSQEAAEVVDNQIVLLDKKLSGNSTSKNTKTEKIGVEKISISKKWILIGAVFGVLVICVMEGLRWLLGGKLNSSEELEQNFDIHVYGLVEERKRHKILGIIDELIYKLKNRNKKILTEKQAFQMILSGICLNAKRENVSSLYMTGTEIETIREKPVIEELRKQLEKEQVNLIVGENILCDSKALLEMVQTGYVILVEEVGYSKYQEILRELEICKNQDVNVFGSIVFTH